MNITGDLCEVPLFNLDLWEGFDPTQGCRKTFSVALTPKAQSLAPNLFDQQPEKIGANRIVPLASLYKPHCCDETARGVCHLGNTTDQDPCVAWGHSYVVSASGGSRPHTKGLTVCIAIFLRTFDASNVPLDLSLTHGWNSKGIKEFEANLHNLINKKNYFRAEIFLCGGSELNSASRLMYNQIREIAKTAKVSITQDLVGLARDVDRDNSGENGIPPYELYVLDTGFDAECNPYVLIDADTYGRTIVLPVQAHPKGPH